MPSALLTLTHLDDDLMVWRKDNQTKEEPPMDLLKTADELKVIAHQSQILTDKAVKMAMDALKRLQGKKK